MDKRGHRFSALYFVKVPKNSKRDKIIGVGGGLDLKSDFF